MGEKRGAYRLLVGKPEGRRQIGKPRCRCEDNIKMGLEAVWWKGMNLSHLAEDIDKWLAHVNIVMNSTVA
jgi:hypothetical protein